MSEASPLAAASPATAGLVTNNPFTAYANLQGSVLMSDASSGTISYTTGDTYTGCIVDGKPEHEGELKYAVGGSFIGTFKSGLRSNGQHSLPDGSSYIGPYENNLEGGGEGTFTCAAVPQAPSAAAAAVASGALSSPLPSAESKQAAVQPLSVWATPAAPLAGGPIVRELAGAFAAGMLKEGYIVYEDGTVFTGVCERGIPSAGKIRRSHIRATLAGEPGPAFPAAEGTPSHAPAASSSLVFEETYEGAIRGPRLERSGTGSLTVTGEGRRYEGPFGPGGAPTAEGLLSFSAPHPFAGAVYRGAIAQGLRMHGQGSVLFDADATTVVPGQDYLGEAAATAAKNLALAMGGEAVAPGGPSSFSSSAAAAAGGPRLSADVAVGWAQRKEFAGTFVADTPVSGTLTYRDGSAYTGAISAKGEKTGKGKWVAASAGPAAASASSPSSVPSSSLAWFEGTYAEGRRVQGRSCTFSGLVSEGAFDEAGNIVGPGKLVLTASGSAPAPAAAAPAPAPASPAPQVATSPLPAAVPAVSPGPPADAVTFEGAFEDGLPVNGLVSYPKASALAAAASAASASSAARAGPISPYAANAMAAAAAAAAAAALAAAEGPFPPISVSKAAAEADPAASQRVTALLAYHNISGPTYGAGTTADTGAVADRYLLDYAGAVSPQLRPHGRGCMRYRAGAQRAALAKRLGASAAASAVIVDSYDGTFVDGVWHGHGRLTLRLGTGLVASALGSALAPSAPGGPTTGQIPGAAAGMDLEGGPVVLVEGPFVDGQICFGRVTLPGGVVIEGDLDPWLRCHGWGVITLPARDAAPSQASSTSSKAATSETSQTGEEGAASSSPSTSSPASPASSRGSLSVRAGVVTRRPSALPSQLAPPPAGGIPVPVAAAASPAATNRPSRASYESRWEQDDTMSSSSASAAAGEAGSSPSAGSRRGSLTPLSPQSWSQWRSACPIAVTPLPARLSASMIRFEGLFVEGRPARGTATYASGAVYQSHFLDFATGDVLPFGASGPRVTAQFWPAEPLIVPEPAPETAALGVPATTAAQAAAAVAPPPAAKAALQRRTSLSILAAFAGRSSSSSVAAPSSPVPPPAPLSAAAAVGGAARAASPSKAGAPQPAPQPSLATLESAAEAETDRVLEVCADAVKAAHARRSKAQAGFAAALGSSSSSSSSEAKAFWQAPADEIAGKEPFVLGASSGFLFTAASGAAFSSSSAASVAFPAVLSAAVLDSAVNLDPPAFEFGALVLRDGAVYRHNAVLADDGAALTPAAVADAASASASAAGSSGSGSAMARSSKDKAAVLGTWEKQGLDDAQSGLGEGASRGVAVAAARLAHAVSVHIREARAAAEAEVKPVAGTAWPHLEPVQRLELPVAACKALHFFQKDGGLLPLLDSLERSRAALAKAVGSVAAVRVALDADAISDCSARERFAGVLASAPASEVQQELRATLAERAVALISVVRADTVIRDRVRAVAGSFRASKAAVLARVALPLSLLAAAHAPQSVPQTEAEMHAAYTAAAASAPGDVDVAALQDSLNVGDFASVAAPKPDEESKGRVSSSSSSAAAAAAATATPALAAAPTSAAAAAPSTSSTAAPAAATSAPAPAPAPAPAAPSAAGVAPVDWDRPADAELSVLVPTVIEHEARTLAIVANSPLALAAVASAKELRAAFAALDKAHAEALAALARADRRYVASLLQADPKNVGSAAAQRAHAAATLAAVLASVRDSVRTASSAAVAKAKALCGAGQAYSKHKAWVEGTYAGALAESITSNIARAGELEPVVRQQEAADEAAAAQTASVVGQLQTRVQASRVAQGFALQERRGREVHAAIVASDHDSLARLLQEELFGEFADPTWRNDRGLDAIRIAVQAGQPRALRMLLCSPGLLRVAQRAAKSEAAKAQQSPPTWRTIASANAAAAWAAIAKRDEGKALSTVADAQSKAVDEPLVLDLSLRGILCRPNDMGETYLYEALVEGKEDTHVDCAKALLAARADIHQPSDATGRSCMQIACASGRAGRVSVIARLGYSLARELPAGQTGRASLHFAVQSGSADAVRAVLAQGSTRVNLPDSLGDAPLHLVRELALGEILVAHGARRAAKNSRGEKAGAALVSCPADEDFLRQSEKQWASREAPMVPARAIVQLGGPLWVPDEMAPRCLSCSAEFGFLTRRHHCRLCGLIYCSSCSKQSVCTAEENAIAGSAAPAPASLSSPLPSSSPAQPATGGSATGQGSSAWLQHFGKGATKHRVCDGCSNRLALTSDLSEGSPSASIEPGALRRASAPFVAGLHGAAGASAALRPHLPARPTVGAVSEAAPSLENSGTGEAAAAEASPQGGSLGSSSAEATAAAADPQLEVAPSSDSASAPATGPPSYGGAGGYGGGYGGEYGDGGYGDGGYGSGPIAM